MGPDSTFERLNHFFPLLEASFFQWRLFGLHWKLPNRGFQPESFRTMSLRLDHLTNAPLEYRGGGYLGVYRYCVS